jgi:hypothetical protein
LERSFNCAVVTNQITNLMWDHKQQEEVTSEGAIYIVTAQLGEAYQDVIETQSHETTKNLVDSLIKIF